MRVKARGRTSHFRTVSFDAEPNDVVLIEQRLLPHKFELLHTRNFRETAAAIQEMAVRGAPAIAATAAYGLAQGARAWGRAPGAAFDVPRAVSSERGIAAFQRHVQKVYDTIAAARPTAVDPVNAMDQVRAAMRAGETVEERQVLALAAAEEFADEDVRHCEAIGRHGARLIRNGTNVLTHCNAGWLACVDVGTATAPMYAAQARGKKFHVYCDETRPRCQGATLTAWELAQQGISHQVIADNAAGHLMQRGRIDLVIVGSDRTLGRTGEVANKIGTYSKAVLAHRHGIPFYVAIPLSTIDWKLQSGLQIPIEERDESEVLGAWGMAAHGQPERKNRTAAQTDRRSRALRTESLAGGRSRGRLYVRIANPSSGAFNPGFDVTPPELITGIITPIGIFKPQELWAQRRQLGGPC